MKVNIKGYIRVIIIMILALAFAISALILVDKLLEYERIDNIYDSVAVDVLDETEKETSGILVSVEEPEEIKPYIPFEYSHEELLSINNDGIGYLYIEALDLKLPLVQTSDNNYYLRRAFNGEENMGGCLFEDSRISKGLYAENVIIYGHNMKNDTMFGTLDKYTDSEFLNTDENNIIYVFTDKLVKKYKIFSCYTTEPSGDTFTFNFASVDELRNYAEVMKAKAQYDTGVDVSEANQILTLSTCATNNNKQRFIVHGVLIEELIPD